MVFPFYSDSLLFAAGFSYNGGFVLFCCLLLQAATNSWRSDELYDWPLFGQKIILPEKLNTSRASWKAQKFLDKHGHLAIFWDASSPLSARCAFYCRYGRYAGVTWHLQHPWAVLLVPVFVLLNFFGGIPVVQEHFELLLWECWSIILQLWELFDVCIRARRTAEKPPGKEEDKVQ